MTPPEAQVCSGSNRGTRGSWGHSAQDGAEVTAPGGVGKPSGCGALEQGFGQRLDGMILEGFSSLGDPVTPNSSPSRD